MRAPFRRGFGIFPAARVGAELGAGREDQPFALFEFNSRARHGWTQFASSSWTDTPRSSNSRRIVSSIKLFGQDAPAVIPTVICPDGNQFCVSTSLFKCW